MYVGNLSYQVQESELEQLFAQAGSVASVFVPRSAKLDMKVRYVRKIPTKLKAGSRIYKNS